jgi:hypothetical protein
MMGELTHIKILSLKCLIIPSLLLKYKEFLESPNLRTHQVLNHSKQTKYEEDIGLELERGLELFFQKN